ncbi:hypothetical protein ABZ442_29860 [Streptomyces triculaminicus]|uniref:hypothetical protein n=1 Tax=Streptomyces triculaminicus TaxID=2816232 RepID=UPI0033D8B9A0
MRYDDALIGHWTSAPFDYGVMEGSDLAFLPDGRGWSVFSNLGGMSVTRFRWHCPAPGRLEIREEWSASGEWEASTGGFSSVDGQGPRQSVTVTGYTIGQEETAVGEPVPVTAVCFDEPVEFITLYARGARDIAPAQDPSYALRPYA